MNERPGQLEPDVPSQPLEGDSGGTAESRRLSAKAEGQSSLSDQPSHPTSPRRYPPWIAPLLGFPLFLCGLGILLSILMIAFPGEDHTESRQAGAAVGLFLLAIGALLGVALLGIVRNTTWGRGVATVAAFLIALTGVGLLIAIPILWGLWREISVKPR